MALVNVVNVTVLDNPTCFLNPFQFEITFECLQELDDDLEWKVLYVGSAHDSHLDQVLDEILVGPVPVGMNKFVLQADPPDHTKLPPEDILGVTVVLIACSYKEREFVRIGYYVNNEYIDENYNRETDPPPVITPSFDMTTIQRQILADKPRLTKFPISWGKEESVTSGTIASAPLMAMTADEQRELEAEIQAKGYNNEDDVMEDDDQYEEDDEEEEDNNNNDEEEDILDEEIVDDHGDADDIIDENTVGIQSTPPKTATTQKHGTRSVAVPATPSSAGSEVETE